jgi:hypothetical protein
MNHRKLFLLKILKLYYFRTNKLLDDGSIPKHHATKLNNKINIRKM